MRKKIKVLECIRQGQIGGGESHLLSLVENLNRSLFDPVVLSFTDGPMVERLKNIGVEAHVIHTVKPFDISKWKLVKDFIRQQQVDIIHAHGTRANSNVLWAARSLNIPVVYTIHGWSFHPDQNPLVRTARIWGEKYLTSRSTKNISVSYSNQQSGKKYISSFDSIIVNNGIDLKKFDLNKKTNDIRAELKIPADEILVLFIARFTSHKQPLSLIRAFAKSLSSNPKMHLLMVGDGDEKAEAVKLVEALNLKNKITLHSFRQDVPDVLAAADIFILPSLWEGLPIGLLEAMSMGKAVIASNVDGTSEIVQNNQNGILIETDGLIENLSAALNVLSTDRNKIKTYGEKAVATVTNNFNASTMTRQIEKIYTELIKSTVHA
jgi:glycosyltransferase involved in cell wall biosynthesis